VNGSPEHSPPTQNVSGRSGIVPLGLAGMLALISLCESSLVSLGDSLSTPFAAQHRLVGSNARRETVGRELLCFGDSQVAMGLSPQILEERSGLRAYSLSLVGAPPCLAFFLLRRALEAGATPRAVLIDSKANLTSSDLEEHLRNLPAVLNLRDAIELTWSARDPRLLGLIACAQFVPSVARRAEIRNAFLLAVSGTRNSASKDIAPLRRNWAVNRGAMINGQRPWSGTPPNQIAALLPDRFSVNPTQAAYLGEFFRLAAARDIRVYWIIPPISPELLRAREERGLDLAYTRWVESVATRHPEVVVLDGRRSKFEHDVFVDPSHLDYRGAAALSVAVGDEIRRRPALGSWVNLPNYRRVDYDLENFDQSKLVVARGGASAAR
jgi:hypothetical protein